MTGPPTREPLGAGKSVQLRDGSRVRVRPGGPHDRKALLRGFERLSPESRYRRFLVPIPELTEPMIRYLTEVDHHDHEAIAAFDEETGEGVGVARYVRDRDRPDSAEVAVTVIDDWHGRGLGTLLVELISARAREEGITRLTALVLASNDKMVELLERLAPVRVVDREIGTIEVEVPIPEAGMAPALHSLLRIAAQEDIGVPLTRRGSPAASPESRVDPRDPPAAPPDPPADPPDPPGSPPDPA